MTWGKMNKIARKHTGEYFRTEKGEIGEVVHWYTIGVDLLFKDGTTAIFAVGDLVQVQTPDNTAQFEQFTFDETGRVVKGGYNAHQIRSR